MSNDMENTDQRQAQVSGAQWAEVLGQLFDRLIGKGASVTYQFDNLTLDIPKAQGPNGRNLVSARWTINGRIIITAETHQISKPTDANQ
jgi:hypothetical protein